MSGFPSLFENRPIFGLVMATVDQHASAPSETNKPLHTLEGNPNGTFIEGSFREAGVQDGDALRTLLQSVLNSFWWRRKDIERMPSGALDQFVYKKNPDDPAICQFCMAPYDTAQEGLNCVKGHIDI